MGARAKIPEEQLKVISAFRSWLSKNGKSESAIKACVSHAKACARTTGGFTWFSYIHALEQGENRRALSEAKRALREWVEFSFVP